MKSKRNSLCIVVGAFIAVLCACEEYDDTFGGDVFVDTAVSSIGGYQAEDHSFQSGCNESSRHSGYTGSGFMDYGGNGSLVEWNNVKAPSAGTYTLTFRYANGYSTDRRCVVTVNDASNAGNVAFRPTGGWTTWSAVSITANLKAGNNKIRVTANTNTGGPNLDKMDLVSDEDPGGGTKRCALVNENYTATLSCPSGQVIENIDFASYGLPTGSCPNFLRNSSCHSRRSPSAVEGLCLEQESCKLGAKNTVFGDPCSGKYKKLAVVYTCSGEETGLELEDFVGHYERTPILNNWHKVDITIENNALLWRNAAGATWSLSYENGTLKTGSDCPYGVKVVEVEKQSGSKTVKSLNFNGESYYKTSGDADACPDDPDKTEPGECGCGVPEGTCDVGCVPGCRAPTPICGPDLKCTSNRWVEPISTLPDKWKRLIDISVWTKWVRSIIPVLGQESTQDAALLEVAYYAEIVHMPHGQVLVPDLIDSMLNDHPTRFYVFPACPEAYMHRSVTPKMSSGGGAPDYTRVSEDWILRYPKCTGSDAVACDMVASGTLCNNCMWSNPLEPETCRDTLAHEHGHTCDLHRRRYMDPSIDAIAKEVFGTADIEGPAWSAQKYFMNPSLGSSMGRDSGDHIMPAQEISYWSETHKFTMSKYVPRSGYILKTTRCPQMGLTQACPDTLSRTYAVPLDSYGQ